MTNRRPTRAELANLQRLLWELERDTAQTVACPDPPFGCGVPIGVTCRNPRAGRPLDRAPAHPARITAAARSTRCAPEPTTGRPHRAARPRRTSAA